MATQAREIFDDFCVLVLREVFGGEQVFFDLIDVSCLATGLGEGFLVWDAHFCEVFLMRMDDLNEW